MGDAATAGRTWVAANTAGIVPPTLDQFGLFNRAKSATTAGVL
jgi:hypothetical protein